MSSTSSAAEPERKLRFEFYFYVYTGHPYKKLTTADMILVGSCEGLMSTMTSDEYNSRLRAFLQERKIYQFIPLCRPTKEEADGVVSICYYHNQPVYERMYEIFEETGLICMPAINNFAARYDEYGLDGFGDPRCNTLVDPE